MAQGFIKQNAINANQHLDLIKTMPARNVLGLLLKIGLDVSIVT